MAERDIDREDQIVQYERVSSESLERSDKLIGAVKCVGYLISLPTGVPDELIKIIGAENKEDAAGVLSEISNEIMKTVDSEERMAKDAAEMAASIPTE